ncbi:MAG: TraR/DksA C4-type zinc finger protein [Pseudomonadota bacterium]
MTLDRDRFRALLQRRRQELKALSETSAEARKAVALDQQSVGRLSRQDALQQQAMAKAQEARRVAEGDRIKDALARIEDGEFGFCAECGEAIALKRLEINPTTELCADCARAR